MGSTVDRRDGPRVLASVVTHNSASTITRCIESLASESALTPEITVFDNASTDATCEILTRRHSRVRLIRSEQNLGFGAAHNRVLRHATHPHVLLLNPDAWLEAQALPRLLDTLGADDGLAIVAPRVDYPDGCPQVSFGPFPGWWADWRQGRLVRAVQARHPAALRRLATRLQRSFRPDWVSGSCFLARTETLREVGFFDERFFLYLEDVDLCRRLRARGLRVRVEPTARCGHVEGASHSVPRPMRDHFRRSRLLYEKLHGSRLGGVMYGAFRARGIDPAPPGPLS